MKNKYKVSFWLCIIVLIGTNIFWHYQTIDNAVGHNYYTLSCEEYKKDTDQFVKILGLNQSENDMISFLEKTDIKYNGFEKGEDYVVQFNSFDFIFWKDGKLKETNQN